MTTSAETSRTEQPQVFVHLLPDMIPPGSLRGGIAVVVDVLRATTVMVQALASGCEAVIPCGEIDEARAVAESLPAGTAILGGERGGLPIAGFDLGNSPGDYTREVCEGKTLVMTTTNGTRAILASREAQRVYIAAFSNAKATIDEVVVQFLKKDHGHSVHIVCAGTEGFVSLEDSLLAGRLVHEIAERAEIALGKSARPGNDESLLAELQWQGAVHTQRTQHLAELLRLGRGGKNVFRIGLGPDIGSAASVDRFDLVAELGRDPLRIIKV